MSLIIHDMIVITTTSNKNDTASYRPLCHLCQVWTDQRCLFEVIITLYQVWMMDHSQQWVLWCWMVSYYSVSTKGPGETLIHTGTILHSAAVTRGNLKFYKLYVSTYTMVIYTDLAGTNILKANTSLRTYLILCCHHSKVKIIM